MENFEKDEDFNSKEESDLNLKTKILNAKRKYHFKCIKTFMLLAILAMTLLNIIFFLFFNNDLELNMILKCEVIMFIIALFTVNNITFKPFIYYKHDFEKEVESIRNKQ